jgi:hypothetical protein
VPYITPPAERAVALGFSFGTPVNITAAAADAIAMADAPDVTVS